MLTSCLGDSTTRITVGLQEAVFQSTAPRGLILRDGRLIYSSEINSMRADGGDCFMVEYSFDSSNPELQNSDSLSVELLNNPIEVALWTTEKTTLSDTLLTDEQYITSIGTRTAYIAGRLFLWPELLEPQSQVDSFAISYDSTQLYTTNEGQRIYNLYLRAIRKSEIPAEADSVRMIHTEAFDIEEFFNKAKDQEMANGSTKLNIAVNYISRPNKDTTAVGDWSVKSLGFDLVNNTIE